MQNLPSLKVRPDKAEPKAHVQYYWQYPTAMY